MSESREYLIFVVGDHQFAVPLLSIREIAETGEIQPLPNVEPHVIGLANLRGEVLGVISLARKFGIVEKPSSVFRSMIVFQNESSGIAAVVDQVLRVAEVLDEKIDRSVAHSTQLQADFIDGVGDFGGKIVPILNIDRVIHEAMPQKKHVGA